MGPGDDGHGDDDAATAARIDRWLWCVRFFKSRSLAAEQVRAGHVRVNGQRVKAAQQIRVGDRLAIQRGNIEQDITVVALPARRGPSAEAQRCYAESAESVERRRAEAERRALLPPAPTPGRPDKRTRRLLLRERQRSS